MQTRFHREALRDDPHLAKTRHQAPELADAERQQHRGIVVFQADLHQRAEGVEPGNAVVDLKHRLAARFEDAAAFLDQPLGIRGVLDHPVGIYQVKGVVREREALAVRDLERASEPLLLEVGPGQIDGGGGEIDAGDRRAAPGKPDQIDAGAAADFENRSAAVAVKGHEPQQMMELLEMVLVEIVEKAAGTDRMTGDLEIVNMPVPVRAHVVCRSHGQTISHRFATMACA